MHAYTLVSTGLENTSDLKRLVKKNEKLFRKSMERLKLWRVDEPIERLRAASTSSRSKRFKRLEEILTKRSSFRKFTRIPSGAYFAAVFSRIEEIAKKNVIDMLSIWKRRTTKFLGPARVYN
ncbi:hypothetical protein EDC01DRAFT_634973 [Geopyxis carbonaria]|nr:hypothetical protein EDC01DRAFT_634973 [Geopyxis carbonaria]